MLQQGMQGYGRTEAEGRAGGGRGATPRGLRPPAGWAAPARPTRQAEDLSGAFPPRLSTAAVPPPRAAPPARFPSAALPVRLPGNYAFH